MIQPGKRGIAIMGSTGSIGTQALEVIAALPEHLSVKVLTARNNAERLIQQALTFKPELVVICNEKSEKEVKDALYPHGIKVLAGEESLAEVVALPGVDMVLTAMVGYTGLLPTIRAIEAGKDIALANKETLVVAGALITELARAHGVKIYPVDSEHSAIFQCLVGEEKNPIEKIILTASGGPFLHRTVNELRSVTVAEALNHPNWSMGNKVTIDSATMMNKGLEMIEAKWLFDVRPDQLEVVIHPQSIIHSMVQFEDGSVKAQLGLPDMRLPIQYALTFPHRRPSALPRYPFDQATQMTFLKPDTKTFRNLVLAQDAMVKGGNAPCVLNAANEVAVTEFLGEKIGFLEIQEIVEECLTKVAFIERPSYDDYVNTDQEARARASEIIRSWAVQGNEK